jgi:hypothetical protein
MEEGQKRTVIIVVAVIALVLAGFSAFRSLRGEQMEIVGELPMAGRDAEAGTGGGPPGPETREGQR